MRIAMQIVYDPEVDVLMVHLRPFKAGETVAKSREVSDGVIIDLDGFDNPIQIEVLAASHRYDPAALSAYDINSSFLSLSEAAEIAGLSATTLKLQVHNGKLRAKKVGRNWVTTRAWLREYLLSRRYNAKQKTAV